MNDMARWAPAALTLAGWLFMGGMQFAILRMVREKVARHDKDLYHGDARKPGLTTRMETVETDIKELQDGRPPAPWFSH